MQLSNLGLYMSLLGSLRARTRQSRRALRLRALTAWRMGPALGVVARVLRGRAQRRADTTPLLSPLTSMSDDARREAKHHADRCIRDGFVLRENPVWKPEPPIKWGNNPLKDINWHYRINTLEQVEPLLLAHRCGAGDEYFVLARRVAIDWIDYNLLRDAPNGKKWHDMASALRGRVFAQILDTELRRPRPHFTSVAKLVWAALKHVHFLADPKNLPVGNHALFMMYGLAYLLRALPELPQAGAHGVYCREQLRALIGSQFSPDGFHLEHSPEYHLYVTETVADLVDNQLFPEIAELPLLVQRARSHYHELFHPNGDLAMLGDSERRASDRHGPDPCVALSRFRSADAAGPLRVYPDSGYAIFRSHFGERATPRDDYFVIGAGHHSRVHKHADHLNFEWSFRGVPVLIGSGKGRYDGDAWRRYFRSTRAGNAVEVDERNYDKTPRDGRCRIIAWGDSDGLPFVIARHYSDKLEMTQIRAWVTLPGEYLLVIDRLTGTRTHLYRQWFHLHEALELEQRGERLSIRDVNGQHLLTLQELTGEASVELAKGELQPRKQGFVSPVYHALVARQSLAFCKRVQTTNFVALFSREPAHHPEVVQESDALRIRWCDAAGQGRGVRLMPASPTPIERLRG